jgi:hypothetical protein
LDSDIQVFGTNIGSANDFLNGMGIAIPTTPMQALGLAVKETSNYIQGAISDYSAYIEEVDRIATYTGMASEETSQLIQVADDLRIETSTLEMALKTMSTNGTEPSIEGLGRLSDQYISIQDPLQKSQFLTNNFGRSGVEMARMMELGSNSINQLTDDVSKYMVITGKSKEEAEKYISTLDNWQDTLTETKYQLSAMFLPTLTNVLEKMSYSNEAVNEADAGWTQIVPVLGNVARAFFTTKQWIEEITGSVDTQTDAINGTASAWDNAITAAKTYIGYVSGTSGNLSDLPGHGSIYDEGYVHPIYSAPSGGGRAQGGEVFPGVSYPVGERQVEMFTPSVPGYISPSAQPQQTIIFNYQPAVSLADEAEAQRVLTPYIMEALRSKGLSYG